MATRASDLRNDASKNASNAKPKPKEITQGDLQMFNPRRQQGLNLDQNLNNGSVERLQFPLDTPKYRMTLGLGSFSRPSLMTYNVTTTKNIVLPLPQQMIDNHGVNYEQKELSTIGGAATSAALGSMSSQSGVMSSIMGAASQSLTAGAANMGGDLARAAFGIAPNQFLTVLLKGPQYKKHEFVWRFSPRNMKETKMLKDIIQVLNDAMAPSLGVAAGYFTFPTIFRISFNPDEKMLYRFKPAVIENLSVNYAPSGSPAFYRGTGGPESVEIKAQFLELEFWLSGDFGSGYKNTDNAAGIATNLTSVFGGT